MAFLFAGWDRHYGFQLYQSDPSGNYSGWKATVIGQNNQSGKSILKTDYSENNDTLKNLKLAVKILLKTMDAATPTPERIEISTMKIDPLLPGQSPFCCRINFSLLLTYHLHHPYCYYCLIIIIIIIITSNLPFLTLAAVCT